MPTTHHRHSAGSAPTVAPAAETARPGRRPRFGGAWAGGTALVLVILLIVLLLQNGGAVQIRFLWLQGRLSLAVALLIAAVGAVAATMLLRVGRGVVRRHRR